MVRQDIGAYIRPFGVIFPQSAPAGTVEGSALSRVGAESAVVHGLVGAPTGTPTGLSVTFQTQHSDNGLTGWEDYGVASEPITVDSGEVELDVNLRSAKTFVRVVATVAFTGGTSPAIPLAASIVVGGLDQLPA